MSDYNRTEKTTDTHTDAKPAKPATDTKTTEKHDDAEGGQPAKDSKTTETRNR